MTIPRSKHIKSKIKLTRKPAFNAQNFLDSAGVARKVTEFQKKEAIFSQGDPAKDVLYIQKGRVRLSVVNESGKEAVVAVLGPGDFFGEGCLAGQPIRIGSATAISATTVLVIEKKEMIRVLHVEHAFSDRFITYMLSRNIRVEEDLVDQLFNSRIGWHYPPIPKRQRETCSPSRRCHRGETRKAGIYMGPEQRGGNRSYA